MTIPAGSQKLQDLMEHVRSTLPKAYGLMVGYRGMFVLESERGNRILAVSFWEDDKAFSASELAAGENAKRLGQAAGAPVSVESFDLIGSNGVRFF
jgi:heme-degrading monooxygenase HmoA